MHTDTYNQMAAIMFLIQMFHVVHYHKQQLFFTKSYFIHYWATNYGMHTHTLLPF